MYLDLDKPWRWHHWLAIVACAAAFFASPLLIRAATQ